MNLGVDAYNLSGDRRGMGRVVRQALRALGECGVSPVLIVRNQSDCAPLEREFALPVATASQVRACAFDAVWYPWNGMRFAPHAYSVVTIHDAFAFTYPHRNPVARYREQAPIRRAIRRADRIFAVSPWTAGELQRLFGAGAPRVQIVSNAPDPFWRPVPAAARSPYFLFLGGAEKRKNSGMLLRAYESAFVSSGPALVLAGSLNDSDEAFFAQMRAPRERVQPDDAHLRELYSGALALLLPSLAEGFGLPAVEAMACGAPVAAADAAALPQTCGGAAMLLPPGDESAWARALQSFAGDSSLREDLRARGLARAAQFNPAAPALALLALSAAR